MKLPSILAGPILRRTDRQGVYVWIATSEPFEIGSELFRVNKGQAVPYTYTLLSDKSEVQSIRFGDRLYIYLIKLVPVSDLFPVDTLLAYNLVFEKDKETTDFKDYGLLSKGDPRSIVYGDLSYPSFFINHSSQSGFLYGSCRKAHGKGTDSLAACDVLLEETHTLDTRPAALFLLGDQIYADDVADPLLPAIRTLGNQLVGNSESLQGVEPRLKEEPFRRSIHQIHGRRFIIRHLCQFTSNQGHNHMLTFPEYAMLYLLSWSPELWEYAEGKGLFLTFEQAWEKDEIYFIFANEKGRRKEHKKEARKHRQRFEEQINDLSAFYQSLHAVRRLLANIPTYMIFDDHDLTDDWNLSLEWKERVAQSPLGKHVITNGLSAYWAFQGWGNDPQSFSQDFLKKMARYFKELNVNSSSYRDLVDCLWGEQRWHFVAPTAPKTVFLDSRTKRSFTLEPEPARIGRLIRENVQSPELISHEEWKRISESLSNSGWTSDEPLVIASPSPLYGLGLIESTLQSYVYPLLATGISVDQSFDYEAWKYNGKGFTAFLRQIAEWKPTSCVILSGDVHYASAVESFVKMSEGPALHILQYTSSPMKNMSFSGLWGQLMKFVTWLNSLKRKNKNIYRYCTQHDHILKVKSASDTEKDALWTESLTYLFIDNHTIVETSNNTGYISLTPEMAECRLLSYQQEDIQFMQFETIKLDELK